MDWKKIGLVIIAAALLLGLAVLAVRLFSGLLGLVSGLLSTLLGLAVLAALAVIVIWMFRFAAKNKK